MAREFSPEERLLRLIRSKTPREAPVSSQKDNIKGEVSRPEQPKQKPLSRAASHLVTKEASSPARIFRIENLNFVLIILLGGLLLFFIPAFFKKQTTTIEVLEEKIKAQEKIAGQKKEALPADVEKKPSFDYFSSQVGARNIFSPVAKEETQTQAPVEEGPKLEEVKGQLSLLGVVWGDAPQAIIEDKKEQKTYFLNKGGTFDDIEVRDILENKVILSYKGKQFELVL